MASTLRVYNKHKTYHRFVSRAGFVKKLDNRIFRCIMCVMRSQDFGQISRLSESFSEDENLEVFRRICFIRYFELKVKEASDKKLIKAPIYLSVGQESVAAALSMVYQQPKIFGQHRCHDVYLAYGGDPVALRDELLHRPTGCAGGMGGSASIHSPKIGMVGHDGLLGTQVPIAVGYALGKDSKEKILSIMGDAALEEDYVMAATAFAAFKKAPILFICLDNNLSVLTEVKVRRHWTATDLAKAFKMSAVEITDDPWLIMRHTAELQQNLPALLNIHVVRHLWHNGTGCDGPPEWDRFQMVKEELARIGLKEKSENIEKKTEEEVALIWQPEFK
ncbi:MAG: hypothetical protein HYW89_00715 [Candidatus Sungiibacteriota bacterium]|uniref:Dehydrogenase E1 component domain-containing protein n=1 Tax=Candidatus Sungiibacteriota bacterium TaxID=2750080 RepID=A0A7T5RJS0_9BACT|nr:MAG: hypothetical protein HYW89_00715 [Candidatus Sungbacteria bacterium]